MLTRVRHRQCVSTAASKRSGRLSSLASIPPTFPKRSTTPTAARCGTICIISSIVGRQVWTIPADVEPRAKGQRCCKAGWCVVAVGGA